MSPDGKRAIAVADEIQKELFEFLSDGKNKKKFLHIQSSYFARLRNSELYGLYKGYKGIGALKFSRGKRNARIYYKQVKVDGKVVVIVCSKLLHKKASKGLSKKIKNILSAIEKQEYGITGL